MRLRALLAPLALLALLVATACGGDSGGSPTTTPAVPTAAPYPAVPSPTLVTGTPTATPTPTGTPSGAAEQTYTVVAGDVLGSIAAKFDVPAAQIRALNNLTGDDIQIGQKLRIPARSATPQPTAAPGAASSYTVKAGDTALGIALQFDTTVEALERANGVAKGGLETLQLGQVVKLPPPGQR